MRKFRDLFIDFDDTLYDTRGNGEKALSQVYAHFGLHRHFPSEEAFTGPYWRGSLLLWSDYAQGRVTKDFLMAERFRRPLALGMGEEPDTDYCLRMNDYFLNLCAEMPGVVPGAHQLMDYLRAQGYGLHLCSNGFREVQHRKLRASGLQDYFDTIILSEDAGANKPSADFFRYALRQSGAQPESTLMIGDNFVTDIQGAKAAGLAVMFFNRSPQDYQAPEAVDYEINALSEIEHIL